MKPQGEAGFLEEIGVVVQCLKVSATPQALNTPMVATANCQPDVNCPTQFLEINSWLMLADR